MRWAWNGLAAASLLLGLAAVGLGLLSRRTSAELHVYPGRDEVMVFACDGVLMLRVSHHDGPGWTPPDDDPRFLGLPYDYGLGATASGEVAPNSADGTRWSVAGGGFVAETFDRPGPGSLPYPPNRPRLAFWAGPGWHVGVPWWFAALAFGLLPGWRVWRWDRRRRVARGGPAFEVVMREG